MTHEKQIRRRIENVLGATARAALPDKTLEQRKYLERYMAGDVEFGGFVNLALAVVEGHVMSYGATDEEAGDRGRREALSNVRSWMQQRWDERRGTAEDAWRDLDAWLVDRIRATALGE